MSAARPDSDEPGSSPSPDADQPGPRASADAADAATSAPGADGPISSASGDSDADAADAATSAPGADGPISSASGDSDASTGDEDPSSDTPASMKAAPRRRKRRATPVVRAHRRRRRRRRVVGFGLLLVPGLWFLGSDLVRRADVLFGYDKVHAIAFWGTTAGSFIFWALVLYTAARKRGIAAPVFTALFALLFTLAAGVQGAFHALYNQYLSQDGQIYSKSLPDALMGYLPLDDARTWLYLVGAFAFAIVLLVFARRWVRPRRVVRHIVPLFATAALVGMAFVPASYRTYHSTSQDIIYFHGFAALVKERLRSTDEAPELRVQRRTPEPVPAMVARQPLPRNVLFILQESQRWDVSCNAHVDDPGLDRDGCATAFSNAAAPDRLPFDQLRSNASTTAISIAHLWSGVPVLNGIDQILSVPLLWEYAHAAGFDTAYWTSQHVMFGSMRLFTQDLPLSHFAAATHLDPLADFDAGANDALLTDRVIHDWSELREPFFAVVHYSNVHFPYVYDEQYAPFQPALFNREYENNRKFFNYYKDVVYLSDMAVGRLLDHIRSTESGRRTVILYTSDHGESFREHNELGHTSSLYDEEIHVPGWIDAPAGTLTDAETDSLRGAENDYITHIDFTPTMLDLMGLWDTPQMAPFRARMPGNPLTRPARTVAPIALVNCAWIWECGFRNWGLMQGPIKLEAREWDDEFHCFDLAADPEERVNLGEAACAPLPDIARRMMGRMPLETPPKVKDLLWGPPPPKDDETEGE